MLVELAGPKFPTTTTTMQGVQKIIKITKVYWKSFGNIFLEMVELKNVLYQVVNYV